MYPARMPSRTSAPLTRADLALAILALLLLALLWALRGVAMLVAFALLIAYVLDPAVSALARLPILRGRRLPRPFAALVVIAVLVGLMGWVTAAMIPRFGHELAGFVQRLPAQLEALVNEVRLRAGTTGWGAGIAATIEALQVNARALLPQAASFVLKGIGGLFARFDQLLGLAVLPVLTFYLLADAERVRESMLRFLPEELRKSIDDAGGSVHRALQSYVRGQALVCLAMGTATGTLLAIAGVPNALFLGTLAAIAEILPFLGALVVVLAITLSGLSVDPWRAVIGVAIYTTNNWLLSTFVTPRVMERYLKLHPFAVIVSVLAGAQLLGPPGAILALPAAAMALAVVEGLALSRRAKE